MQEKHLFCTFLSLQVLTKYLCIGFEMFGGDCISPSPSAQNCLHVSCKTSHCPRPRKTACLGLGALSWSLTLAGSTETPMLWEVLAGNWRSCFRQSKGENCSSAMFTRLMGEGAAALLAEEALLVQTVTRRMWTICCLARERSDLLLLRTIRLD